MTLEQVGNNFVDDLGTKIIKRNLRSLEKTIIKNIHTKIIR